MEKAQFQQTKIPLWSATTLEPYPEDQAAIRKLSAEHLVEPVRFRELTDKLYEEGARIFIQVGTGGLIGFIDDTLKGKAFSTIASSVPTRSALAQLQRVVASLFVEGKTVALDFLEVQHQSKKPTGKGIKLELGSPIVRNFKEVKALASSFDVPKQYTANASAMSVKSGHPLVQAFQDNVADMIRMQEEVLTLFRNRPEITIPGPAPVTHVAQPTPRSTIFSKDLYVTLESHPYLIDHSLLRQPKGWTHVADMEPVIPMTMIFEQLAEIAEAEIPETQVHKIMNVSVFQWMNVAKPFGKTVKGEWRLTVSRLSRH